jgi:predicted nuclease of predicted toxin-antitoxin system
VNLLADESVDAPIVWLLREAGHTVHYIAEMKPGVSDAVVLDHANREACPLITADKDFGELVFRQRLLTHGVVTATAGWGIAARQGEHRAFGDS